MATPIPKNRVARTSAEIVEATLGMLVRGDPGCAHIGMTTDSRQITPGCVFVALRGEQFDGHAFAAAAAKAGATLLVLEKGRAGERLGDADIVEVDDTLVAWGALAHDHLRRWRDETPLLGRARVVAITGSAGKTTTKSMLAALLAEIGETHATLGNLNNRIGVPAMALALEARHRFGVFEVGMNLPGEIAALAAIVEPEVAILTNVGIAHAERLGGTRSDVGREKGALFEALPEAGCAVINADDDEAELQSSRSSALHAVCFGRAAHADYRLLERSSHEGGSRLVCALPGRGRAAVGAPVAIDLPLFGEAAAVDFLAALAATEFAAGRPLEDAELTRALARMAPVEGRAKVHRLGSGVILIDDSYNANPISMAAAVELAVELSRSGRIVAVLGEMLELGPAGDAAHAELGDTLSRAGVHTVIGCGGAIERTLEHAARGGVAVLSAKNSADAADVARGTVAPGDTVLVKGSRGARTERVVEALLATDFQRRGTSP